MKKKIFIAEDDPDISFILQMMLNKAGYEVEATTNGRNIIELANTQPDLYILDKQMPDVDGIEVCKFLKSRHETRDIPVIMISATPGFGKLAKKVGAEDFLEKPFHMHDLLNIVAKYIDRIENKNSA